METTYTIARVDQTRSGRFANGWAIIRHVDAEEDQFACCKLFQSFKDAENERERLQAEHCCDEIPRQAGATAAHPNSIRVLA